MEELPFRLLHTDVSGLEAPQEAFVNHMNLELVGVPSHGIIFSYAPPDMVRQAKLEAMELKVRRKILEHKVSLLDTHALRTDLSFAEASTTSIRVSARSNNVLGSRELVKSLVVPPEVTEHGEEVRGSSAVILDGERLEYQHPGHPTTDVAQASRALPGFRMYEPGNRESAVDAQKKPTGVVVGHTQTETGGRSAGRNGGMAGRGAGNAPTRGQAAGNAASGVTATEGRGTVFGGRGARSSTCQLDLRSQLSEGMLTYVPSKFERPAGVDNTAFVPQGQAMADARSKYESVKQRRPASAPLRGPAALRSSEAGLAGGVASNGSVKVNAWTHGGGAGATSQGWIPGSAARNRQNYNNVAVVDVEETDLLAMYRQKSQQQQHGAGLSHSASVALRSASSRALGPAAATASTSEGSGATGASSAGGGARRPLGASTTMADQESPPKVHAAEQTRREDSGAAKARPPPASAAAASAEATPRLAWGSRSPSRVTGAASVGAKSSTSGSAVKARKAPIAPATAAEAVAMAAAAAGKPWSSRPAWPLAGSYRRRSPTTASSRPVSMRRLSAPEGTAADGIISSGEADAAFGGGNGVAGLVSPMGLQPADLDIRRKRQDRPGSAISTAKTNRLRGGGGAGGSSSGDGASAAANLAGSNGSPPAPSWTSSSSTHPVPCDRTQLQQRILGGLIRQYTLGAEEGDGGKGVGAQRRGGGDHSAAESGVGGLLAAQRSALAVVQGQSSQGDVRQYYQRRQSYAQAHHHGGAGGGGGRPQSAPNRRVRPPSAGQWAGRPDPDSLLSRASALQHSTTGVVYDPELQPSPLDSYVHHLGGKN